MLIKRSTLSQPETMESPRRSRKRWLFLALAMTVCVGVVGLSTPAEAAPESGMEAVSIHMDWDQSITALESSVVTSTPGKALESSQHMLDSEAAGQLPVRVRLSYQAGELSGTNLADLKGYSGQVVIQLSVENMSTTSTELEFESEGAKYRRFGLLGIPYTVVAWVSMPVNAMGQVVKGETASPTTDGSIIQQNNEIAQVMWTAMLAPPVSSPVAHFTLVINAKKFDPPTFDVVVEPGLVTDPSLVSVHNGTQEDNAQAVVALTQVRQQLDRTQELVDEVRETLSGDAESIGRKTFAELSASSAKTLAEIESLKGSMRSIAGQASTHHRAAASSLNSTLVSTIRGVDENILGDPSQPVLLTPSVVDECGFEVPVLADDQPVTVSSTLQLLQEQTYLLSKLFDDEGASSPSCRQLLVDSVTASIGDPSVTCLAKGGQSDSIICSIGEAQKALNETQKDVENSRVDTMSQLAAMNTQTLWATAKRLEAELSGVQMVLGSSPGTQEIVKAQEALRETGAELETMSTSMKEMQGLLAQIHTIAIEENEALSLESAFEELMVLAEDVNECQPAKSVEDLVELEDCSLQKLASVLVEAQLDLDANQALWVKIAELSDVTEQEAELSDSISALTASLPNGSVMSPSEVNSFVVSFGNAYSGKVAVASSADQACSASRDTSKLKGATSSDELFAQVNDILCRYQGLASSASAWSDGMDKAFSQTDERLATVAQSATTASREAQNRINDLSARIQETLDQQTSGVIQEAQTATDTVRNGLDQAQKDASQSIADQVEKALTQLNDRVDSSVLGAEKTRQSLDKDFRALMIDLGDPSSETPTGLIGKLRSTSKVTGTAADQLGAVSGLVDQEITTQVLITQVQDLHLQQLQMGQQKIADLPWFSTENKPAERSLIYTYHIGQA